LIKYLVGVLIFAEFLRGILDNLEAKQQREANRINKVRADVAKEDEKNLLEAQERFDEKFASMRQLEIDNLVKSRMTLENATKFFEQHQRPNLERSLKATYGLPV